MRVFTLFFVLVIVAGCSNGHKLVPVSGKVTFNGTPVGINQKAMCPARISFLPKESGEGCTLRPATATLSRENGTYELSTFEPGDGIMPGEYHVLIVSMISTPSFSNPTAPKVSEIPERYGQLGQSGLSATVPQQRAALTLDFELKP